MTDAMRSRDTPAGGEDERRTSKRTSADEPCPTPTGKVKFTRGTGKGSGEGSFRGLLSGLSRTADRSAAGPPIRDIREMDTGYYLREEMQQARQAVKQLDTAVQAAVSFREAASKLLGEAHRAMGRLEKAVNYTNVDPDLIDVACEIKCAAKRGITLVDVYGKYNTVVKIMTLFLRSYIHSKFEKQTEQLRRLMPPPPRQQHPQAPLPQMQPATQPPGNPPGGGSAHPGGGGGIQPATSVASGAALPPVLGEASPVQAPGAGGASVAAAATALARSSMGAVAQVAAPPAPAATPAAAAGMLVGKLLQGNRHERVTALSFVPVLQMQPNEYVCIWWSAGQSLEFYNEAAQSSTAFQQPFSVTALAVDDAGTVWTGNVKGQLRVMPSAQWERTVEEKAFTGTVKVIAFDEAGRAWVGDDGGRIKVLSYDPRVGQLETVASLQRTPGQARKGGLFGKRHCANSGTGGQPSAAAVFAAANAAANTVAAAANTVAAAAVAAATAATQAVIAGPGGRDGSPGSAAAIPAAPGGGGAGGNVNNGGSAHCGQGAADGPVRCIFVRGAHAWTSGGRMLQLWDTRTFQDLDVFECGVFGPCHSMAALRWPSASAASSYHPGMGRGHRHTNSDGSVAATAPPPPLPPSSNSGGSCTWRLLTGHDNGQLLLWHPEHRTLAPLLRIGEPCTAVRGIAVFEAYNLVVTGHHNGCLRLFRQPAADGSLPPGSDSAAPQSLGFHRPKTAMVTAHRSRLERMASGSSACATASHLNTIRLWHASDLAQEAQKQNVTLTHTSPSYTSLATAGDFSQGGPAHLGIPGSLHGQYQRESARTIGIELAQTAGSQALSPATFTTTGAPHLGLGSGSGFSSHASGLLAPSTTSTLAMQMSPGLAPAAGGLAGLGGRGSKDSLDTAGGTQTQPSSSSTVTTATVPLTADTVGGMSATGPSVSSASFAHFQTIEYSELKPIKIIGSGAYGEVLLADWTGSEVAVKKLFAVHTMDDKESGALLREVTLLGSLSHPNIVRFLAVCVDPPCIVMQYYPHGSLFDLLRRAQKGNTKADKELTWTKRLDMLRDVAAGMHYLHTRKPPVIHGDLRSPNLLLDLTIDRERPRFHVKIADFGLARMATGNTGSVMVSKTTNPRWLAPEVIQKSSVGKAADVYSFSIIMWEMLTWKQPYQDMMSVQVMFSTVNDGSRPDVPPDNELPGTPGVSLDMYRQLMEKCWQTDAAGRPSFKEIVEVFQEMLKVEAENARQLRQQQQAQQQQPQQLQPQQHPSQQHHHVSGLPHPPTPPLHTGLHVSSPGGSADHTPRAPIPCTANVPAGGSPGGAFAAATVAAAARRAASAGGVASPFVGTFLGGPGEHSTDNGSSGSPGPDSGVASYQQQQQPLQQQHGSSVLPFYAMSPILEETASASTNASPAISGRTTGAPAAPHDSALPPPQPAASSPPQQPPQQQHYHHQQHTHTHGLSHPHPHVHFAPGPSPFSQPPSALGGSQPPGPASSSCPASPAVSSRARLAGAATTPSPARAATGVATGTQPLSSPSSTDSGAVHAVSGGSNIGGAPSTASSSRQSSTSTSGRTIAAAAAAATAPAAAAAAGGGARKGAGTTGSGAALQQMCPGGAALATPRREAVGHGVGAPVLHQVEGDGGAADGDSGKAPGLEATPTAIGTESSFSTSVPVAHALSCLSPFASMPAAQLSELDAAVPHLAAAAAGPLRTGGPAGAGAHPARGAAAPASPRLPGTHRGAGAAGAHGTHHAAAGGRGMAAGAARPGSVGNVQAAAAVAAAGPAASGGARGRIPGAAGSHTPTPRSGAPSSSGAGTPSTPSGTPRAAAAGSHTSAAAGTHSHSHSQPGTPPYRGPAVPASSGGTRRPGTTDSFPRAVAVSAHAVETAAAAGAAAGAVAAARMSHSAAHPHLDHHDEHSGVGGSHLGSNRPGHRRTPSGGSVGSSQAVAAVAAAAATTTGHTPTSGGPGRTRDLMGGAATASPHLHDPDTRPHPRTPTAHLHGSRATGASPRLSAPNAAAGAPTEPRLTSGARRLIGGQGGISASVGGGGDISGSPSAPSSGHLSRLAAAVIAGASARPPASPRSYIPGGPGATSMPSPGHGGMSRIPSVTQAAALQSSASSGSKPGAVGKSDTSRSLDDGHLRGLGLSHGASVSPPLGPTAERPAPAAGWEDGLDGGEYHSPVGIQEAEEAEDPQVAAGFMVPGGDGERGGGGGGGGSGGLPYGLLPRIATKERKATSASASGLWQPPPLLAATPGVGVDSPFAAAAYASPFFTGDADGDGDGDDGQAAPGSDRAAEGEAEGPGGPDGGAMAHAPGSSGVVLAATSPKGSGGDKITGAWSTGSSGPPPPINGAAAGAAGVPPAGPAVRASASASVVTPATASPFAQLANDQDSWWDEQRQHDD